MSIIKLDLEHGLIFVDSVSIELDQKGTLVDSIAKLCSAPMRTSQGRMRYQLLRKVSVCGQSADVIIEIGEEGVFSINFLFDLIEFFESSILESKIIKACEKHSHLKFNSNHPSVAFLNYSWGSSTFFYDAKQGDLSLEIKFERKSAK